MLGSYVTWKIQARQLAHEDKTRFHERRLAVYTEFTTTANRIIAAIKVGPTVDADAMLKFSESYELLRLVATTVVMEAALSVHSAVIQVEQAGRPIPDPVNQEFNEQLSAFITKAREEMGVDELG